MLNNFEYITTFSYLNKRNIFLWKVHLNKSNPTQNNLENRVLKVSPNGYCYIYNTDSPSTIFSIISSRSCFMLKKFCLLRHEKKDIYSKLVSNPFKYYGKTKIAKTSKKHSNMKFCGNLILHHLKHWNSPGRIHSNNKICKK